MPGLRLVLLLCLLAAPLHAAIPEPVMAVIDVNRIMREARAVTAISEQVEKISTRYSSEVRDAETRLREEDKALTEQRGLLSKEAYKAKAQELRGKLAELRSTVQRQRVVLDRARSEAVRQVRLKLLDVARGLAREHGANIVIQKSALVWADEDTMELTEEALKRLNEELPSVVFEVSR